MLMDCVLSMAQLFTDSMDQFTRRLATAGLASNVTAMSVAPVDGYTLAAQMRALNHLPTVDAEAAVQSAGLPDTLAPPPPPSR